MPSLPNPEIAQEDPDTPAYKRHKLKPSPFFPMSVRGTDAAFWSQDPVRPSYSVPAPVTEHLKSYIHFSNCLDSNAELPTGVRSEGMSVGHSMAGSAPDDVVNALLQQWTTVLDDSNLKVLA